MINLFDIGFLLIPVAMCLFVVGLFLLNFWLTVLPILYIGGFLFVLSKVSWF